MKVARVTSWVLKVPFRFPLVDQDSITTANFVEIETDDGLRQGVYIPRRDTSSRLNVLAGGRIFPGSHDLAHFDVREHEPHYRLAITSKDGRTHLTVEAERTRGFTATPLFNTCQAASDFFAAGSCGYSPQPGGGFEGLQLRTRDWRIEPLNVERVTSSFFDDVAQFPQGSIEFDNGLLMRNVPHEWHPLGPLHMRDRNA
jgi:hypothetical protein